MNTYTIPQLASFVGWSTYEMDRVMHRVGLVERTSPTKRGTFQILPTPLGRSYQTNDRWRKAVLTLVAPNVTPLVTLEEISRELQVSMERLHELFLIAYLVRPTWETTPLGEVYIRGTLVGKSLDKRKSLWDRCVLEAI